MASDNSQSPKDSKKKILSTVVEPISRFFQASPTFRSLRVRRKPKTLFQEPEVETFQEIHEYVR